jgi:hypothetical protein
MISSLTANPLLPGFIVLAIATLVLLVLVFWMYFKLRRFLVGIDSDSIKDSLTFVGSGLKELESFRSEMENYLSTVESRLKKSVQSVHTVRFNPFHGTGAGGNQSFATAFLNEHGDGVIVSSLYARDHVSVFAKPVKNLKSEHELSDEEKEALDSAKMKLRQNNN